MHLRLLSLLDQVHQQTCETQSFLALDGALLLHPLTLQLTLGIKNSIIIKPIRRWTKSVKYSIHELFFSSVVDKAAVVVVDCALKRWQY